MSQRRSLSIDFTDSSGDERVPFLKSASSLRTAAPVAKEQFNFDHDDAVTLHVGPAEHVLLAHGSFITRNSDFFAAALKKEWAEGQTRVITLPEERPEVVSHYLNHTYAKALPSDMITSEPTDTFTKRVDEYQELLAELCVLGERLLDKSIKTAVIDEVVRLINPPGQIFPTIEARNIIYRGTTAGSPARHLMVDIQLNFCGAEDLDSRCEPAF